MIKREHRNGITAPITPDEPSLEMFKQFGKELVVGSFISFVIHELNNKMGPILLYSELLQTGMELDTARKHLRTIEQTTMEARNILNALQMFVRKKRGQKPHTNITDDINEVQEILQFQLRKKDIKLEFDLSLDLPLVDIDSLDFEQTLFLLMLRAYLELGNTGGRILLQGTKEGNVVIVQATISSAGSNDESDTQDYMPNIVGVRRKRIDVLLACCKKVIEQQGGSFSYTGGLKDGDTVTMKLKNLK